MKFYKQIIFILVVFLKTETLLSEDNLFNVNNIQIEKKDKISNNKLANQAIKKGFEQLIAKILLEEDREKFSDLNFSKIKQLVSYYQITNFTYKTNDKKFVNLSITFDKDKIHDLFYQKGISYSQVIDKELFVLPLLIKDDNIFIFNNNFFYDNWNEIHKKELIEFILPLENIEIIQNINKNKADLINLEINKLFQEYVNKNLALILIEDHKSNKKKVYIKAKINEKNISKNLNLKKVNSESVKIYERIIIEIKRELTNLVKSENLIDVRTPSFLNARLDLKKNSNLVELNSRIKKIDLIENISVKQFNKDYMYLRIKYLGKLKKIIEQLNNKNINLIFKDNQWHVKVL